MNYNYKALCVIFVLICVGIIIYLDEGKSQENKTLLSNQESVIVAINPGYYHYEFYDDNNELVGVDVEIANIIGAEMGLEIQFVEVSYGDLIDYVEKGMANIAISSIEDNELDKVNYSHTYIETEQIMVSRENETIEDNEDLENKIIGVKTGSIGEELIEFDYDLNNIIDYGSYEEIIGAILSEEVDVGVLDVEIATDYITNGLKANDINFGFRELKIAVNKNDAELLEEINIIIEKLKADGKIKEIVRGYFGV